MRMELLSEFRGYSSISKSEATVLIGLTTKSATKLMVEPPTAVGPVLLERGAKLGAPLIFSQDTRWRARCAKPVVHGWPLRSSDGRPLVGFFWSSTDGRPRMTPSGPSRMARSCLRTFQGIGEVEDMKVFITRVQPSRIVAHFEEWLGSLTGAAYRWSDREQELSKFSSFQASFVEVRAADKRISGVGPAHSYCRRFLARWASRAGIPVILGRARNVRSESDSVVCVCFKTHVEHRDGFWRLLSSAHATLEISLFDGVHLSPCRRQGLRS